MPTPKPWRACCAALLLMPLASAALAQAADDYPARAITIVVPNAPGGGLDTVTRLIAERLRDKFGQPVVVDNRAGGTGSIGASAVARAEPDGYTLLASPNSPLVFNPLTKKQLGYDPKTFTPVIQLGSLPLVLAVRGNFPANSLKEFVAYAKANPGKLNYSSQGVGGGNHLSTLLLQKVTGTSMVHIPYSGEAPARQALVAGDVDLFMAPLAGMLPLHRDKRVKILAVGSSERAAEVADVPTFQEQGYPGELILTVWYALVAPPKTPDRIAEKLNKAINEIMKEPDIRAKYAALGTTPVGGPPDLLRRLLDDELRRWTAVVESAGIPKE